MSVLHYVAAAAWLAAAFVVGATTPEEDWPSLPFWACIIIANVWVVTA